MGKTHIQIVPALPPEANGVGDYALAVARVMRDEFGLDSLFLMAGRPWNGARQVEGFAVRCVETRSAAALLWALTAAQAETGSMQVLLQLSGYGYSRRGCPWWLLRGLRQWKAANEEARLETMFHELYATASPWRVNFWVGLAQRRLMAEFARHSDRAVTSIERYGAELERLDRAKRGRIEAMAVPSNVGEPPSPGKLSARDPRMVVFGQPASRRQCYDTRMAALQSACAALGVREVCDVGPSYADIPERIGDAPVRRLGWLESRELSALLMRTLVGFVAYPQTHLAKSGVFAAFCAHRVLPVVPVALPTEQVRRDGLEPGVHYLAMGDGAADCGSALRSQAVADAAWNWYQGHSLQRHARLFAGAPQEAWA